MILAEDATGPSPLSDQGAGDRHVLLHYHLFKNAGTSLDTILKKSFGDGWVEREFDTPHHAEQMPVLQALLLENRQITAFSSHTLLFPLPQIPGMSFFPIVFVREPMARLRSAYEFERQQDKSTVGANLAKQLSFAGYLERRLSNPNDRSCRDFQTYRLARHTPASFGSERARALATVDLLPFVGLVERFDTSVTTLQNEITTQFPTFKSFSIRENVTTLSTDHEEILADIRRELGPKLYDIVLEANEGDIALHEKVKRIYG
jgi:hypothetical protein